MRNCRRALREGACVRLLPSRGQSSHVRNALSQRHFAAVSSRSRTVFQNRVRLAGGGLGNFFNVSS